MSTASSLDLTPSASGFDVVVAGLHLRWDGVYQRPQHVLTRIAQHVPVVIVEEPLVDGRELLETIVDGNVTILRPHRKNRPDDTIDSRTIAAVRARIGPLRPLVWLYTPMMLALADAFTGSPLVFDAMDELAKFANPDPRLLAREDQLLARASMVFCGGPSLYRSRAGRSRHVRLYSSGVDVAFFEQARHIAGHPLVQGRPKPIFGYIGVIDERVDLALIESIADARPDATLAMVGPIAKIEPSTLPVRPNIVYLGQQNYSELPALLAAFDVALMPFALNESTLNISPTKTLEYLAAGKPVVSTAVPDVVSEYAGIVNIAHDRQAFIAALTDCMDVEPMRRQIADERTRAATWDAIAAAMLRDLDLIGISVDDENLLAAGQSH